MNSVKYQQSKIPTLCIWVLFIIVVLVPSGTWARTFMLTAEITNYPGEKDDLNLSSNSSRAIVEAYRKQDSSLVYLQLFDEQVTNDNLLTSIRTFFDDAEGNDIVILYIHGHGYNGGYKTYDSWLDYDKLRNAMSYSKSNSKMIFADCCHSGSLRTNNSSSSSDKQIQRSANKGKVMLFLSSRSDEVSWVTSRYGKGFFTAWLCKALEGAADSNNDQVVSARELYLFVKEGVVKETTESGDVQHPVMWGRFPDKMPVIRLHNNR